MKRFLKHLLLLSSFFTIQSDFSESLATQSTLGLARRDDVLAITDQLRTITNDWKLGTSYQIAIPSGLSYNLPPKIQERVDAAGGQAITLTTLEGIGLFLHCLKRTFPYDNMLANTVKVFAVRVGLVDNNIAMMFETSSGGSGGSGGSGSSGSNALLNPGTTLIAGSETVVAVGKDESTGSPTIAILSHGSGSGTVPVKNWSKWDRDLDGLDTRNDRTIRTRRANITPYIGNGDWSYPGFFLPPSTLTAQRLLEDQGRVRFNGFDWSAPLVAVNTTTGNEYYASAPFYREFMRLISSAGLSDGELNSRAQTIPGWEEENPDPDLGRMAAPYAIPFLKDKAAHIPQRVLEPRPPSQADVRFLKYLVNTTNAHLIAVDNSTNVGTKVVFANDYWILGRGQSTH